MTASRSAVVIGAGITGTLVGHALAKAGWRVTVTESEHLGAGSSSRTAAGIRQQFGTRATVAAMRYAVSVYRDFPQHIAGAGQPYVPQGYLFLHDDDRAWSEAVARVAVQRDAGLHDVEILSPVALSERFPWLNVETLRGGTWCPSDGFLHPSVVYQDAAAALQALGGTLLSHAPVTGCEAAGDRIVAVHTPRGTLSADLFVDATNAWTRRTARLLGAADLPVAPLKRHLWFLRRDGPMPASTLQHLPMIVLPSGVYARPENDSTLLIGHAHDTAPEPDFAHDDQDAVQPGFHHQGDLDSAAFAAWAALADAVPDLGAFAGLVATTAGYYGNTPDHNPYLGFDPCRSNLLRLVGFSGHGAMFGPFSAALAVAFADAGHNLPTLRLPTGDVDLAELAVDRTPGTPEAMVI